MRQLLALLGSIIFFVSPAARALCVSTATANLRTGPGPNYPTTWVAPLYTPLLEIKKSGGWVQVEDMSGDQHWVYRSNVTSQIVCVSARWNTVKIRKGPSNTAELADLRFVDKFTPFKRVDVNNEWFEVEASWGDTYWVHESAVWRPVKISKIDF